jgi:hypothetical protein
MKDEEDDNIIPDNEEHNLEENSVNENTEARKKLLR